MEKSDVRVPNKIVVANAGESIDLCATRAITEGCQGFLHNGFIYYARVEWLQWRELKGRD